jgi:hypothetical protein
MEEQTCELPAGSAAWLDLGGVLGQNHAFGLIAGRCSAAQAAGLHRLREQKLYKRCAPTWEDFCRQFLNVSRAEADKTIRLWQEFGHGYFAVAQWTRISPETYRAIQPSIHDGKLYFNDEAIDLNADNTRKLAAAVAALRSNLLPAGKPVRQIEIDRRIAALEKKCNAILSDISGNWYTGRILDAITRVSEILTRTQAALEQIAHEKRIR